ncbi:uncharacterized protein RAG0_10040 [Rhynchosporium agropyri]|uniref:Uncharacterized protein n=1 Tax=Rhynchosporium agropyri TaxID=914238 RepID=A0A1E1KY72_9HELO|nr:uncharacterized protein RAG0_10040 [Rhynchosporium agropyri]
MSSTFHMRDSYISSHNSTFSSSRSIRGTYTSNGISISWERDFLRINGIRYRASDFQVEATGDLTVEIVNNVLTINGIKATSLNTNAGGMELATGLCPFRKPLDGVVNLLAILIIIFGFLALADFPYELFA